MTCETCTLRSEINALSKRLGHDLRAPLRALTNIPVWIREDLEATNGPIPRDASDHFDMIKAASHRMDRLIDGLVEFVAAASGEQPNDTVDAERELNKLLGDLLANGNVTLSISSEVNCLRVVKEDFQILFGHLISNAKFHCGENTSLSIRGSLQDAHAHFEVEDDGPGIAIRYRDRIFDPFEVLQSAADCAGCGLGLATARKIASFWGGTIFVTAAEQSGSVFHLQFPHHKIKKI